MATIDVHFLGTLESRSLVAGRLRSVGDLVVVQRGEPRLIVMMCPCGCGEELAINLDSRSGKAWHLYWSKSDQPSLFPSVWRDSGCQSHFIMWRGRIWLLDDNHDPLEVNSNNEANLPTESSVLGELGFDTFLPYGKVAEKLDAIPWDVLWLLRRMARAGKVVEGSGDLRGSFRRK